jgi:WD40 repeat protein
MGTVWSLAFSPDGKFLAVGGRDSPVRFWDLETDDPSDAVTDLKSDRFGNFAFSPDGTLIAGGCRDTTVRIWDVATLTEKHRLTNASYIVAFSGDGKRVLAATSDGTAHWWDFLADTKKPVPAYAGLAQVTCVDLSVDRRVAAVGRADGDIQLLEIDSGRILDTYRGHTDAVIAVAFAPGGKQFVSGSRDRTIRIWDIKNPARSLQASAELQGAATGLVISRDARTMISGCSDSTILIWDMRRLDRPLISVSRHQSAVRTLAFSPDQRILASGGDDKAVKLWDFASRTQLASFRFDAAVRRVAFSPDGNNLAVVTEKGTLRLLRAVSLTEADDEYMTFYNPRVK